MRPIQQQSEFRLEEAVAVLERTPAAVRALLDGLPEPWTSAHEGPDTFSAHDVVGHLLEGERTDWIARAEIMLGQGVDRRFAPFDRFAHQRAPVRSTGELLAEFARLRAANLDRLRGWGLTAAELALEGEHPEFGAVTLQQLLSTWVAHDLGHIAQIARVMAKRYRTDVGPWRAYLPVLDR